MLDLMQAAQLDRDGAVRLDGLIAQQEVDRLLQWSAQHRLDRPGERISDLEPLRWLLSEGSVGLVARSVLGERTRPVRGLLFDKTPTNNWALGWHQDRTIAVRQRHEVQGFSIWTAKSGIPHVEPPFELIERMITVRIHLDAVDVGNGPLRVVPGSHQKGKIAEGAIEPAAAECGELCCLDAGDVWVYRTAILHASGRAEGSRRRRVLQVDYSAEELPSPLEWWAASRS